MPSRFVILRSHDEIAYERRDRSSALFLVLFSPFFVFPVIWTQFCALPYFRVQMVKPYRSLCGSMFDPQLQCCQSSNKIEKTLEVLLLGVRPTVWTFWEILVKKKTRRGNSSTNIFHYFVVATVFWVWVMRSAPYFTWGPVDMPGDGHCFPRKCARIDICFAIARH